MKEIDLESSRSVNSSTRFLNLWVDRADANALLLKIANGLSDVETKEIHLDLFCKTLEPYEGDQHCDSCHGDFEQVSAVLGCEGSLCSTCWSTDMAKQWEALEHGKNATEGKVRNWWYSYEYCFIEKQWEVEFCGGEDKEMVSYKTLKDVKSFLAALGRTV